MITLIDFSGGESIAGGKLKEVGYDHWNQPNTEASDSYGFTALPGGFITLSMAGSMSFGLGSTGSYWSRTEYDDVYANYLRMFYNSRAVEQGHLFKWMGMSVRCIKD